MTKDEAIKQLNAWRDYYVAINDWTDRVTNLFCASPEVFDPIFKLWAAYTGEIAEKVGDELKWLEYFCYECDMGNQPLTVISTEYGEIKLTTIEDLYFVITKL